MIFESGKIYNNKTWKYLFPCLKAHGDKLVFYLSSFFKAAVGIGDMNYHSNSDCIYILFDLNIMPKKADRIKTKELFTEFLEWVRYKEFYETDYIFDISLNSCQHMLVIKIPDNHLETYGEFLKGHYSNMYTLREVNKYFALRPTEGASNPKEVEVANNRIRKTRDVLRKTPEGEEEFIKIVNERFKTNIDIETIRGLELDFPIELEEEFFNFKN